MKSVGYNTDGIIAYNKDKIISSIKANKPVYARGERYKNNIYEGHAWVIDGAMAKSRTVKECIYEYIGTNTKPADPIDPAEWKLASETSKTETEEYVRCNFGYKGEYDAPCYYHEVFDLGEKGLFKYNLRIITNIRH